MSKEENSRKLKIIRGAYKAHNTRSINRAKEIMDSESPDLPALENLLEGLTTRMKRISTMNDQILTSADEADI